MSVDVQEILVQLQPSLSVLQDSTSIDRYAKRRAIQTLHDDGLKKLDNAEAARAFLQITSKVFITCIALDNVEKCREQCLELVIDAFRKVDDASFALVDTVDLCKKRIAVTGRMKEPAEESEEIRLGILRLLNLIMSRSDAQAIKPVIADDIISIVQSCMKDRFPDVQREACGILLTLTKMKSAYVGYFGDKMTEVVMPILRHKHAALRTLGIKATEHIVLTSTAGLKPLIQSTNDTDKSIIESLAYDNSPTVREALSTCITRWLTLCSPIDRYEYAGTLLPLLMTTSVDDIDTVRINAENGLVEVGCACINDMKEAGILPESSSIGDEAYKLGISNLTHHSFKDALKSISHILCIPFNQNRLKSLKVMRMYLDFSLLEDIIPDLRFIVTILATVKLIEKDSSLVHSEIANIINVVSAKIPKASFYLDILLPSESTTAVHEGGVDSATALWLLSIFLQYSLPRAITLNILTKILDCLKSPSMSRKMMEEPLLVPHACAVLYYSTHNYAQVVEEVMSDALRYKVILTGTRLLALYSITSENFIDDVALSNSGISETAKLTKHFVFQTFSVLYRPAQDASTVYAHYLPTLLENFRMSRSEPPERWKENSLPMRMVEVILENIEPQALEDEGAPEQLVEILVKAGSQSQENRSEREIDSSQVRTRIRSIQNFIRLYTLDDDTIHFLRYSSYIFNHLLMACFSITEPHMGACTLNVQDKLRQQTIICLTIALEKNAMNLTISEQDASQTMLINHLHHIDERTRELSTMALVAFLRRYLTSETETVMKREQICLDALLDRVNDEKKSVRSALYSKLPSILGILSNDAKQSVVQAMVDQLEFCHKHRDAQSLVDVQNIFKLIHKFDSSRAVEAVTKRQAMIENAEVYNSTLEILK